MKIVMKIFEIIPARFLRWCHLMNWFTPWKIGKEIHQSIDCTYGYKFFGIYITCRVDCISCSCGKVFFGDEERVPKEWINAS